MKKEIDGVTYVLIEKTEFTGLDCLKCDAYRKLACIMLKGCKITDSEHENGIRSKYWEVKK